MNRIATWLIAFSLVLSLSVSVLAEPTSPQFTAYTDKPYTPLAPPATRSPRETLFEFIDTANAAASIIYQIEQEEAKRDGWFHSAVSVERAKYAEEYLEQAIRTLNLSEVPEVDRRRIGLEHALMLRDILDRIVLPEVDAVPDFSGEDTANKITRWEIPGTEIAIVRGTRDQYIDEYLFSPNTVRRIPEFYDEIKSLKSVNQHSPQYRFYTFYISSPGHLLPPKWHSLLPDWSQDALYFQQTIWQWGALFLTLLFVALMCFKLIRWDTDKHEESGHTFLPVLYSLMVAIILWGALYFIENVLNITSATFKVISVALTGLIFISLSWSSYVFINWLAERLFQDKGITANSIDLSVIRTIFRLISIVAATTVLYFGAEFLGVPIAPLLAGFGALGLAIGIGAQEYFKNVVGGLTLFLDRPVSVGEKCDFNGIVGKVEEIGLRSTKIRTEEKQLMVIPNATFSTANITNHARIRSFKLDSTIGLDYAISRKQLLNLLAQLRMCLEGFPTVQKSSVFLDKLSDYSLNIRVKADVITTNKLEFAEFKELFFLKVLEIVENEGCRLAYPTQTLYLAHDDKQ